MRRNLPNICAEQLFVLMAQRLQHFFAFVLSNLATAFFSQVTHLCLFRSFLCFHLFFGNYIAITLAHVLIFANVFLFFLNFFYAFQVFFLESDPVLHYIPSSEGKQKNPKKKHGGLKNGCPRKRKRGCASGRIPRG